MSKKSAADNALHLILRFNDRMRRVDTLGMHKTIEQRYGHVWWGKFGRGVAQMVLDKVKSQIDEKVPTYVYLYDTIRRTMYRSRLLDILGGGNTHPAPDPKKVPSYYAQERCPLWFKLTSVQLATAEEVNKLVLFNSPRRRPRFSNRGLVYVKRPQR